MSKKYPQLLLRFEKNEEKLLNTLKEGIFRIKSSKRYRELEDKDLEVYKKYQKKNIEPPKDLRYVSDPNEGLENFKPINEISFKIDNKLLKLTPDVSYLKIYNEEQILCFYNGLNHYDETSIKNNKTIQKFTYNKEMNKFGEFCLFIYNTDEFHKRIMNTKQVKNYNYVNYINDFIENNTYDNFIKHKIFSFQQEYRYIFNNNTTKIKLGSIEDIAKVVHVDELENIEIFF
ncbi:hypothetical protein ACTS94_00335 [Empedobacter falsenii]